MLNSFKIQVFVNPRHHQRQEKYCAYGLYKNVQIARKMQGCRKFVKCIKIMRYRYEQRTNKMMRYAETVITTEAPRIHCIPPGVEGIVLF